LHIPGWAFPKVQPGLCIGVLGFKPTNLIFCFSDELMANRYYFVLFRQLSKLLSSYLPEIPVLPSFEVSHY